MDNVTLLLGAAGIFGLLVVIQIITRAGRPVRRAVGGILAGWGALGAVNLAGLYTGVVLPISFLSLGVSAVAGIPGVTLLLLLNLLL
ncbi:MAG TPA: pro-sigmaK processing inhibitor BofA family protein [Candidatus Gallacutalibacter pullicola]|uniref:Pro-sigmaK processing inhibitor BofA family protein n=1 Tax=Candidatus Gallacutalibacter pullicola TaxID=2840830 RepID=A0A9D1DPD2_9FIRM|nr:pro-sigmaK processing inhibitor BofA family protein [Candidatus Gallacutalibacter pullicola]